MCFIGGFGFGAWGVWRCGCFWVWYGFLFGFVGVVCWDCLILVCLRFFVCFVSWCVAGFDFDFGFVCYVTLVFSWFVVVLF